MQNDNARRLRNLITGDEKKMYTGLLLPDGTITLAGAPTNKAWVRYPKESREQTAAWGIALAPNIPVYVRMGRAGRYISGVDFVEGTQTHGAALIGYITLPPMGDLTGMTVDGLGFKPGRLERSALGGLYVHVPGFHYADGFWRGGELSYSEIGGLDQTANDVDLTAYAPATSGHVGWVRSYLDNADGTLHFVAGATASGDLNNLDEADIHAIPLPYGVTPLGAVGMVNGMTAWGDNPRFVDARYHLSTNGATVPSTSAGLAALISDETGSGALVFDTAPTLITPTFIAAVALVATFLNTGASGSGGGAFLNLYSDDGAAMASGDRLGGLGWGGAEDAAGTRAAAVAIAAFALEAWSASAHGSYVRAEYTPLGTTVRRAAWFAGLGKVLTDNTVIDLLSITRATNTSIGGVLRYSIMVFDGTDLQVETGEAFYSGYNKGGTRVGTITKVNAQQDLSAGTLTTTWAISNVAVPIISINANSSLTPSAGYPLIRFTLDSFSGQAVALA